MPQYSISITNDNIYVGGHKVINIYSNQGEYQYSKFTFTDVYSSAVDSDGNIWFSSGSNVLKFDGNEWVTYEHDSASFVSYNNNRSIHIDKKGHLWIGCLKGIYRYDNYNFHFMQPNSVDESINFITEDSDGNIWVAGQHGLSKYTFAPDNIEDFIASNQTLELYPNPTSENFSVNLPDLKETDLLMIYSITGECILIQEVNSGANIISTVNISSGKYIVKLKKSQKYCKLVIE